MLQNKVWRLLDFALLLLIVFFHFYTSFSYHRKFVYSGYGCEFCKEVSKLKMADSKAGTLVYHKMPKFCSDYFSLTTQGVVFIFDMVNNERQFENLKSQTQGLTWRHAQDQPNLKVLISSKPFRSPPLNHIYSCVL